ncbi:bifunctional DNA primase/polymerase [Streptomyces hoynatensis]|uniref:DNA primase n=1 Tax=Streptomyces hoynatensis TaxID=1141874 RepID=A0A3A9Z5I1_9ACTN|nr:bifunctional DNA primase/polymerase [Streptomyces hoynatensis]RKN43104.1 DNA primase [Streptomyces hoynatensis]
MAHDPRVALLNAALAAVERGWPVFPLRPGDKRPAGHSEDRCPRAGRCAGGHLKWEQRATLDPGLIRAAWARRPYNVGIATGPAGLVVVDLDAAKPGDEAGTPCGVTTFQALCERAGAAVPTTYRIRTASGGQHLYFAAPTGVRLRNSAGRLGPRIDTRAWGGYVVAPGSITPRGTYEVIDPAAVAPLPGWLRDALTPPPPPATPVALAPVRDGRRVAVVALERESTAVASAPQGQREYRLFVAARAMGRFVAWGDIPRHAVEEAFQAAGQAAGLTPHECRSTLRSALEWSLRTARPRDAA